MDYSTVVKILNSDHSKNILREYKEKTKNQEVVLDILFFLNSDMNISDSKELPFCKVDKKTCTDELWNTVEAFLHFDIPIVFRSKLLDFGWVFYKKVECAQKAFHEYLNIIETQPTDSNFCSYLCRCISISQSLKNAEMTGILKSKIESLIYKYVQTANSPNLILSICFDSSFLAPENLLQICEKIETICNCNYESYYKLKLKLIDKAKDRKAKMAIHRKLADIYISRAHNQNIFANIKYLKLAIRELRQISNTDAERIGLNQKLSYLQKEMTTQMEFYSIPLEIDNEIKFIQNYIETNDIQKLIFFLVYITYVGEYETIKMKVMQQQRDYAFSSMFDREFIDKKGKTISMLPRLNPETDKNSLEAHICFYLKGLYSYISAIFIAPIVDKIKTLPDNYASVCQEIVDNCFFIPENRKKAFSIGLVAGLNGDYITSLSILLPQLENSFRVLGEDLGGIVYSMENDGTERVRTMDDIINLPELKEALCEDLLMNIKAIFLSKHGANLRNSVAHGLIDDADFSSSLSMYAWAFIFRLCYIWQSYDIDRFNFQKAESEKLNEIFNNINKKA